MGIRCGYSSPQHEKKIPPSGHRARTPWGVQLVCSTAAYFQWGFFIYYDSRVVSSLQTTDNPYAQQSQLSLLNSCTVLSLITILRPDSESAGRNGLEMNSESFDRLFVLNAAHHYFARPSIWSFSVFFYWKSKYYNTPKYSLNILVRP